MRYRAGLIGSSNSWMSLLSQEGFPGERLRSPDQLIADDFSVVMTAGAAGAEWEDELKSYVEEGGAAIVSQEILARWMGGTARWEKFSYLVPSNRSPLRGNWLIDVPGRGLVCEKEGVLLTEKGSKVLPIIPIGDGVVAAFPVDFERCARDTGWKRRLFHSPVGQFPSERVSRVPKGELRMMFHSVIEALHHLRELCYVHLASLPGDSTGLFGVRIDTDYSSRVEVERLYSLFHESGISASWFLHAKSHVGWIRDFKAMEDQEIGLHCYAHDVYGPSGLNRAGIEKGRDLLRGAGLDPGGFAAPYGIWREELPGDLEFLGFQYSSEFGFDYDNTPSFPWTGWQFSQVVQVPVHPISIGNLNRDGFSERDMIRYYEAAMSRKVASGEPALFYFHPGDGHLDVIRAIVDRASSLDIIKMTFLEYAGWWRERHKAWQTMEIVLDGDEVTVTNGGTVSSERIKAEVTTREGRWSRIELSESTDARMIVGNEVPVPIAIPSNITALTGQKTRRLVEDIRTHFWRKRG